MSRLLESLARVAAKLESIDAAYALVGGLAMSVRTEPRFTRDIDLCIAVDDDEDAARVVRALDLRILAQVEQEAVDRLATVRSQERSGSGPVIDLLFASSGIEAEIVARAERVEIARGVVVPVAIVSDLIALKVLARDDAVRPQDRIDLVALLRIARPDQLEAAQAALSLITERGYARGRDLAALFDEFAREVRPDA